MPPRGLLLCLRKKVADMSAGESREMLFLDAAGHVSHAAGIVWAGEVAWLFSADAPGLAAFLESMKFHSRVEVKLRSDLLVGGFLPPALPERCWRSLGLSGLTLGRGLPRVALPILLAIWFIPAKAMLRI